MDSILKQLQSITLADIQVDEKGFTANVVGTFKMESRSETPAEQMLPGSEPTVPEPKPATSTSSPKPEQATKLLTPNQKGYLRALSAQAGVQLDETALKQMSKSEASELIEKLKTQLGMK